MSLNDQKKELLQRVSSSITIPEEEKARILDMAEGRLLPPLTLDSMAKFLFSPDTNPERFDFIMQRVRFAASAGQKCGDEWTRCGFTPDIERRSPDTARWPILASMQ